MRKGLGLDQKAFGKAIGVAGRDTISRWERGLGFPSVDILINIRQIYRINMDWLISGEGEPFIGGGIQIEESTQTNKIVVADPVEQLFYEEEVRTGLILTEKQRTAILKILRELIDRDVRSIRELLGSMEGGKKKRGEE